MTNEDSYLFITRTVTFTISSSNIFNPVTDPVIVLCILTIPDSVYRNMKRRSLEPYIRHFLKEEPPEAIRDKLITRYKYGPLKEYEEDVAKMIGSVSIKQFIYTDPATHERLLWEYVGDFWWCRYRKKSKKHEFSRLVAVKNDKSGQVVGLWDQREHNPTPEPEIVYDESDRRGVIVGSNEFEIWISWDGNAPIPVRDISKVRFEFIEDFDKYKGILSKIKKA